MFPELVTDMQRHVALCHVTFTARSLSVFAFSVITTDR